MSVNSYDPEELKIIKEKRNSLKRELMEIKKELEALPIKIAKDQKKRADLTSQANQSLGASEAALPGIPAPQESIEEQRSRLSEQEKQLVSAIEQDEKRLKELQARGKQLSDLLESAEEAAEELVEHLDSVKEYVQLSVRLKIILQAEIATHDLDIDKDKNRGIIDPNKKSNFLDNLINNIPYIKKLNSATKNLIKKFASELPDNIHINEQVFSTNDNIKNFIGLLEPETIIHLHELSRDFQTKKERASIHNDKSDKWNALSQSLNPVVSSAPGILAMTIRATAAFLSGLPIAQTLVGGIQGLLSMRSSWHGFRAAQFDPALGEKYSSSTKTIANAATNFIGVLGGLAAIPAIVLVLAFPTIVAGPLLAAAASLASAISMFPGAIQSFVDWRSASKAYSKNPTPENLLKLKSTRASFIYSFASLAVSVLTLVAVMSVAAILITNPVGWAGFGVGAIIFGVVSGVATLFPWAIGKYNSNKLEALENKREAEEREKLGPDHMLVLSKSLLNLEHELKEQIERSEAHNPSSILVNESQSPKRQQEGNEWIEPLSEAENRNERIEPLSAPENRSAVIFGFAPVAENSIRNADNPSPHPEVQQASIQEEPASLPVLETPPGSPLAGSEPNTPPPAYTPPTPKEAAPREALPQSAAIPSKPKPRLGDPLPQPDSDEHPTPKIGGWTKKRL